MRQRFDAYGRVLAAALVVALAMAVTPALAEPTLPSGDATPTADLPGADAEVFDPTIPSVETTRSAVDVPVDEETLRFRERLAAQQAEIDAFKAQLDELDRQLAIAVESYNASLERLEYANSVLDTTLADLERAREAYKVQADILADRVRFMYQDGELNTLEVLFDAKSLSDFFDRFLFLSTMSRRDGEVVSELASERQSIEEGLLDIQNARLEAEALEFDLEAQQIEIVLRIEERQQMLASAQSDLLTLLNEEAVRRQAEQQALLEAIRSGASDVGIVLAEGTPVETAFAYHGIPYLWGGETPSGFDCSGLVLYVFEQHGIDLPHYSGSQFLLGVRVAPADLKPGDVVFFGTPIHHVGIYVGAGYFIHAPRTGDFVKVSPLAERTDYAGARRYDWQPRVGPPLGVEPEPADLPTS